MGKRGPCCHCGVTSTPLWRNGPPEKPVLCNACGSRWRTKGSLVNYTPLHLRAEHDDYDDHRSSRMRNSTIKNNDTKVSKRKRYLDNAEVAAYASLGNKILRKSFDEDGSNRSSSGSAISNSDSCAVFVGTDVSDQTGPSQNMVWDSTVPSRKRTCVSRPNSSPIEKLTRDLYTIFQEQQASCLSGLSEDDVLLETDKPMVSVEIGHGSVLIKHPSSIAREEESESSSLSVDNKLLPVNEAYSQTTSFHVNTTNTGVNVPKLGMEKIKKVPSQSSIEQDQAKRDLLEKLQLLGHHNSPLCNVGLNDVVNFDLFMSSLTSDEQLQMHKYLPSVDTSRPAESLKTMFESSHFKETVSSFQKLLGEGVFDNSLSGVTAEDSRILKRYILCNLAQSKWVEHYSLLKDPKCKGSTFLPEGAVNYDAVTTCNSVNTRTQKFQGVNKRTESSKSSMLNTNRADREPFENDASSYGPRNLFALPPDESSFGSTSFESADASYDQDLLVNAPANNSFPQAELFFPTSRFSAQASTSSSSVYPRPLRP